MDKYTIKDIYGTNALPRLFCKKGTILRLKKDVALYLGEDGSQEVEKRIERISKNTLFKVNDIVGYGFDLVSLDVRKKEVRFMNSRIPEYFEIVMPHHS